MKIERQQYDNLSISVVFLCSIEETEAEASLILVE